MAKRERERERERVNGYFRMVHWLSVVVALKRLPASQRGKEGRKDPEVKRAVK
jgi:hypothetical protein